MGGTLTLDLIRKEFTGPLSIRLNGISSTVGNMQGTTSVVNIMVSGKVQNNNKRTIQVVDNLYLFWDNGDEPCPIFLSQDF